MSTVNKSRTNPILKRNEIFISLNAYDDIHMLLLYAGTVRGRVGSDPEILWRLLRPHQAGTLNTFFKNLKGSLSPGLRLA